MTTPHAPADLETPLMVQCFAVLAVGRVLYVESKDLLVIAIIFLASQAIVALHLTILIIG